VDALLDGVNPEQVAGFFARWLHAILKAAIHKTFATEEVIQEPLPQAIALRRAHHERSPAGL